MRGNHMNLQELGVLLKQERERRGLTVRDVMDSTKISRRNLNALEDGEVKLLPHPVYLKGYVRNYARLVGLDAEPLVCVVDEQWDGDSAYAAQKPAPAVPEAAPSALSVLASAQGEITPPRLSTPGTPEAASGHATEQAATAQPPAGESEPEQQCRPGKPVELSPRPRKRLWPWILLLLLICGGAGIAYQCQRIQAEDTQAPPLAAPAANATDVNATDVNATDAADASARDEAAELANATAAQPEPFPAPAPAPAAPVVAPAPTQAAAPAQAAEVHTPGMQELVVVAKPGEICWVEVSEGQRRKTFTIRDGDSRRFEFSNVAKVRLGNAGGVSFRLNGSFYPYEGQRGQTATLEIGAR